MFNIKSNRDLITLILKVVLSIVCYLGFTIYTVPMYHNVREYFDQKLADKKGVVIGDTSLVVEVVSDKEGQEKGLSNREVLEEGTGMFFIFNEKDFHSIWMKDMKISLDVLWFNEFGEIIFFVENMSPDTYPTIYTPPQKAKYIIEAPAGFIKKEEIKLGDTIEFY